jgi:hypothetical protein
MYTFRVDQGRETEPHAEELADAQVPQIVDADRGVRDANLQIFLLHDDDMHAAEEVARVVQRLDIVERTLPLQVHERMPVRDGEHPRSHAFTH